jgi:cysteine desulfurase/selenocysteine lyase
MLAQRTGARIEVVDITDSGEVPLEDVLEKLHTHRPKLVAMSHVSNALGTVLPLAEVTRAAHEIGAVVLADGAQAAPHLPVNLAELDVDFYCFSGHKLYGPTGSGVLFGKYDLLAEMDPYQGGGDMIRSVTFEETLYAAPPARFEAGTPDIAAAIGLGAAVDFVLQYGMETLARREQELLAYGTEALASIGGLRIVGTAAHKVGVLGFVMEGAHPHDIGTIVDAEGVAIRTGHHCAQPVMDRFGLPATARASLGIYNSTEDIDRLVDALRKVKEIFG